MKGFQKGHPNYLISKKIQVNCRYCNKLFGVVPSLIKRKHFCSKECYTKSMIGRKILPESIEKGRLSRIGHKVSEETRKKISFANSGENNGMFKENSFMNICRKIRKRDNYICMLCSLHQEKNNNKSLDVHHIDYNHLNNLPQNMISLCHSCHAKTNKSKREFWIQHFQLILSEKYDYKYTNNNEILIEFNEDVKNVM